MSVYTREEGMPLGMKLFLIGFLLIFIGTIVLMLASLKGGAKVSGGVVIVVFPFIPIGVAWGDYASIILTVLTVIAVAIMILNLILVYRRIKAAEHYAE
ncbi:MAG: hypothetical protein DRN04_08590 [Thermoprotei archaeon]|nr:MAG: hypothetical protein DRN04_08590 [Thermoprotei archaeon]